MILLGLAVWAAVSLPVAVLIGKCIRVSQQGPTYVTDERQLRLVTESN